MPKETDQSRSPVLIVVSAVAAACLALSLLAVAVIRFGGASEPLTTDLLQAAPTAAGQPLPARPARQEASRSDSGNRASAAWVGRVATATGIPAPALRAYANAQLRLGKEQPGCHLGWNTLAGIGWVESHHGTIGDRVLNDDGTSSSTILGPALDGSAFAAIPATPASTAWHGDPSWDHAVGPLQFLSSTWERWGADGDGNGVADPRDLDDAALAAGRYLCADAHDLSGASGWSRAVHSYNHDNTYVANVASAANTYAARAS